LGARHKETKDKQSGGADKGKERVQSQADEGTLKISTPERGEGRS